MSNCTTEPCDATATTTVSFPRSEADVENEYCDGCVNDLLQAGVKIAGTYSPPAEQTPASR